jgi:hypothetical protein
MPNMAAAVVLGESSSMRGLFSRRPGKVTFLRPLLLLLLLVLPRVLLDAPAAAADDDDDGVWDAGQSNSCWSTATRSVTAAGAICGEGDRR